jgi:hypothetical protein
VKKGAVGSSETLVPATRLHGITFQKTTIFMVTAMRTSNPANKQISSFLLKAKDIPKYSSLYVCD